MLLEPVPDAAKLPSITLLPQFSPKLADVAAALKHASIKIARIGVDRVWVAARSPFSECASLYPSLDGAKPDIELASDVGLAYTTLDKLLHLLIEAVPTIAVLLLGRYGWRGRNLRCCAWSCRAKILAGSCRFCHNTAMRLESGSQGFTQVAQKMPTISDLDGSRSSPPRRLGIGAGSIAADNLRSRMRSQPCSHRL